MSKLSSRFSSGESLILTCIFIFTQFLFHYQCQLVYHGILFRYSCLLHDHALWEQGVYGCRTITVDNLTQCCCKTPHFHHKTFGCTNYTWQIINAILACRHTHHVRRKCQMSMRESHIIVSEHKQALINFLFMCSDDFSLFSSFTYYLIHYSNNLFRVQLLPLNSRNALLQQAIPLPHDDKVCGHLDLAESHCSNHIV